ncbi:FtsW/RodA/SpoVE family cell cycle protein, partial [Streptomyces virginiae]|uniref:FtsW/RodA/SpoVE family cell cycle protein n=3 Tax=Streptomyces TaxID=1883 RepID=UPI00345DCB99
GHAAAGLAMNGELPPNLAYFTISMTLLSLVGHLGVRRFAAYADPLVFPLAMLLTGLGLVLIHRLDQGYIERWNSDANAPGQLLWTVVGVAACIAVLAMLRDHRLLQRFIYITMAVALVLLIAPAFFGADTYGAKRWIILFGFSVQPGEFV